MATLVLKIIDFIRLDEEVFMQLPVIPDSNLTQLSEKKFIDSYNHFFDNGSTPYRHCVRVFPEFWQKEIINKKLPIRYLFSGNAPEAVNQVITIINERNKSEYQGVNFYNYFAVDGKRDDLLTLLRNWQAFMVPADGKFDPVDFPLETCYLKGEIARFPIQTIDIPLGYGPIFPGPPWPRPGYYGVSPIPVLPAALPVQFSIHRPPAPAIDSTQHFWDDLSLTPLLARFPRLFSTVSSTSQPTRTVMIHDVESGWELPNTGLNVVPRLLYGVNPNQASADELRFHGRCVLELLNARHDSSGPADIVKGIAPTTPVGLYSAYDPLDDRPDDALLNVLWQHAYHDGDILLIEVQLNKAPNYDGFSDNVTGFHYPVETEQALFDLISMATGQLNLIVIEPAGNQFLNDLSIINDATNKAVNLDKYLPQPFRNSAVRASLTETDSFTDARGKPQVWAFYTASLHRDRTLQNKPDRDSGAIMVGAARQASNQWKQISNYGSRIDVYAPGFNLPLGIDRFGRTSSLRVFGGTSGASALIAGSVALLQQIRRAATSPRRADWTSAELRTQFRTTLLSTATLPITAQMPNIAGMANL